MLSFNELKLMSFLLRVSCSTGAFPLDWNSRTRTLSISSSSFKPLVTWTLTIVNLAYVIFIAIRFLLDYQRVTDPEGLSEKYRIFHILFGLIHIIQFGIHAGAIAHREELVDFVNQLQFFNMESGKRYFATEFLSPIRAKKREGWLNLFLSCLTTSAIFLIIAYPLTRHNSYYIYSLFYRRGGGSDDECMWLFWIFYLCQIGFVLDTLLLMSIVQVLAYIYYVTSNFWLRKVCIQWPLSTYTFSHSLHHLQLYQSLRLLNNLYNRVFSEIWIPTLKGTCTLFAIVDVYGTVRLVNRLPLLVYLYLPVIYIFFIILFVTSSSMMAEVYHVSVHYKKRWLRHTPELAHRNPNIVKKRKNSINKSRKYFQKMLKSCRPLRCEISTYFMQRSTKANLIGYLINGGISVLLAFD